LIFIVKYRYAVRHFGFFPIALSGTRIMTDTTAANNNDAVAAVDNGAVAAQPDATVLAKEVADLKDRLLRSLADMENLRRRTDREVADARAYGVTGLARDMVGVVDNMRRALEAAGDAGIAVDGPAKALLEGVELTERELLKVLERHGVKRFDPHGAKFDPNLHQAMFEVPDANVPSGSVVQVVQSGYMIGDRVLRPAMVGVSKGGPKTAPPERSADEKQSS
jgi:molecular chaperone GrpE